MLKDVELVSKELDLVVPRLVRETKEEVEEEIRQRDISPAYYGMRSVEELAKARVNYKDLIEVLEDFKTVYKGISKTLVVKDLEKRLRRLNKRGMNIGERDRAELKLVNKLLDRLKGGDC